MISCLLFDSSSCGFPRNIPSFLASVLGLSRSCGVINEHCRQRACEEFVRRSLAPQRDMLSAWLFEHLQGGQITFEVGQGQYLHYTQIVTQNRNGPCSLIALCNIMVLRGDIQILPQGRTSASYEHLASLVGDYLVNSREGLSDVDLTAALAVLPSTY